MSIFDNMEDITEVSYYVEATPGMVASLVINQTNEWDSLKQMTCPVTLTVLKVEKTNGNFAGRCGIALYKFVLMDANSCILKAQLNTGQSTWMKDQDVTVGASIFVNCYHYVWHEESTLDEKIMDGELGRGVMVIDKFTWKDGPKKAWDAADRGVEDATSIVSDDFAVEFVADTVIAHHEKSVVRIPNRKHLQCLCYGKQAYFKCMRCPNEPPMHLSIPEGNLNSCFLHYHNTSSFGAWKGDWNLVPGQRRNQWKYPTDEALQESARQMERLNDSILQERAPLASNAAHSTPPRAPVAPQFARAASVSSSRREMALRYEEEQDPNPVIPENVV